jgi:hypothetical protein
MKQAKLIEAPKANGSFAKALQGYDTGQLLTVLEAVRDLLERRGLELRFTTSRTPRET